ncbi:MAG TPA: hypothetical protein VNV38_22900 [Stellaceae bacterium]|jgi:hypothetical protein|nr:hypothetical protein [Stellaceae bacterium]
MALRIDTFDNVRGGNALYKALAHPLAATPGRALIARLRRYGKIAIVDPQGAAEGFAELFDLSALDIAGVYVQDVARIGKPALGRMAEGVPALARSAARAVLVAAFDADRLIGQIAPFVPQNCDVFALDEMRIPAERLTNTRAYLDPLNFATNFVLFRDTATLHTRLVTTNYWSGYGSKGVTCWLTLFDGAGQIVAEWSEAPTAEAGAIVIDSREVRERFGLDEFAGQLFLHVAGAAGHDIVKYALDTYGSDDRALSCTHDANAWPSDRYAGLPAPASGEQIVLWLQNSHATPIPAGTIGLAAMGSNDIARLDEPIGGFATRVLDVAALLPDLAWPAQIELHAGKHMVRPRYEVIDGDRRRIAHVNVERGDLKPNPELPHLAETLGKGYLLPAPILPRGEWQSVLLPTPMAVGQAELPIAAIAYDADGKEVARHRFGRLPRVHRVELDLDELSAALGDGYGHVELVYDFAGGGDGDGWLHALFRYRHRASGHAAETSFGAHVFNTILTYRDEPQSYSGRPPGLSTTLFLRLGDCDHDTLCHLIYPASLPWRAKSTTDVILRDEGGVEIARKSLAIPCSGSLLWRYHELFDQKTRKAAGHRAYAVIRDPTCRLFGYHGLIGRNGGFSLDHMFGY